VSRPVLVIVAPASGFSGYDTSAAESHLCARLSALAPLVLLTTDGSGPPAWAARWAHGRPGVVLSVLALDGAVRGSDEREAPIARWATVAAPAGAASALDVAAWREARGVALTAAAVDCAVRCRVVALSLTTLWTVDPDAARVMGPAARMVDVIEVSRWRVERGVVVAA